MNLFHMEGILAIFTSKISKKRKETPYGKFKRRAMRTIEGIAALIAGIIIAHYWD
ncbi:unnamed protein product [marine sediment metagenome]|uniref:Uncharacterized protein n=1 Tax=marine sediment metagenome TaxID=412755 RepID=X1PEA0_9ZZZZ